MSPEAIQSLIEMFGVEKGVQILNLFTVQPDLEEPENTTLAAHRPALIRSRRRPVERTPVAETISL